MKYSEEEYDKIWDFLEGNLEDSENRIMIEKIKSDATFREEVTKCERMLNNLHYLGGEKFISKLGRERTSDNIFKIIFKHKRTLSIAATVFVVFAAGYYVWDSSQNHKPGIAEEKSDKDSTSHTETPPSPVPNITLEDLLANNLILPIENVPQKFESAVDKINQSHQRQRGISELQTFDRLIKPTHKEGEPLFGASREKSVEPEGLSREEKVYQNLYLGIAYLKSKEYTKALSHLEKAKENKEAQWYLALTYLGQKDVPKAMELARNVAEDKNNPYNTQADQLLEQLKQHEK